MESKLSCEEMEVLISAYYDNELSELEVKTVKDHLNSCKDCFKHFIKIEELSKLIKRSDYLIQNKCNDLGFDIVSRLNEENITCSEVLEELSAYYDGEVSLKLHYLISDHLDNCLECYEEYSKLEELSNYLKVSSDSLISKNTEDLCFNLNLERLEECRQMQDDMSAFLDNELEENDVRKFKAHLEECKYCKKDYEDLKKTKSAVNSYFHSTKEDDAKKKFQNKVKRLFFDNTNKLVACASIIFIISICWTSLSNRLPNNSFIKQQEVQLHEQPMFANSESFIMNNHR